MQTIAELQNYIRVADKLLDEEERQDILDYLAEHPKAGSLMVGTGGVRKLKWGRGAQGKSGGVRVIYYFHNELIPVYLLAMFAKNEQENLTKAERKELSKLTTLLVQTWEKRKKSK